MPHLNAPFCMHCGYPQKKCINSQCQYPISHAAPMCYNCGTQQQSQQQGAVRKKCINSQCGALLHPTAMYCATCTAPQDPVMFQQLISAPNCVSCSTKLMKPGQKLCHECGASQSTQTSVVHGGQQPLPHGPQPSYYIQPSYAHVSNSSLNMHNLQDLSHNVSQPPHPHTSQPPHPHTSQPPSNIPQPPYVFHTTQPPNVSQSSNTPHPFNVFQPSPNTPQPPNIFLSPNNNSQPLSNVFQLPPPNASQPHSNISESLLNVSQPPNVPLNVSQPPSNIQQPSLNTPQPLPNVYQPLSQANISQLLSNVSQSPSNASQSLLSVSQPSTVRQNLFSTAKCSSDGDASTGKSSKIEVKVVK